MPRSLSVWLVTVGEPLPLPGMKDRLWRAGLFAATLVSRGHRVLWWTSTVDHFRKSLFVEGEPRVDTTIGVPVQFLSGCLYRRNVSAKRMLNQAQVGRRFAALSVHEPRPDVIVCSFPTIELSREAVRYGAARGVPVVLDVRDLWPDAFVDLVPAPLRGVARLALAPQFRDARNALRDCAAIYGVSDAYLEWGVAKAGRGRTALDAAFPLGYERTPWSPDDEASLHRKLLAAGADPTRPLVTFVGTFGRTYDLGPAISAARTLAARPSPPQLVLCGAGEREREWREAARGVDGVAFPGWLPGGELSCLLERSTIGLAAYAAGAPQGIPNKVIEYLSAGLPVVCSLPGESRALLETNECGVYFEAGNAESLAALLEALLGDAALRERMGRQAAALFRGRYSAAAVYGAMAESVEALAKG